MSNRQGWRIVAMVPMIVWLSATTSGCFVARATGETFEAVGVGVGRALGGVSNGFGHAVAGTGRAVTRAANSGSSSMPRSISADAELVSDDDQDMRF